MAIKKQLLKTKPVGKVRFSLSAEEADGAQQVYLVGDFNEWNKTSTPMNCNKAGVFSIELELPKNTTYRFRYLLDSSVWKNDPEADGYERCEFASDDNSLLHV